MRLVKRSKPKHGAKCIFLRVGPPEHDEFLGNILVNLPYVLVRKVQGDAIVAGLLQCFDNVVWGEGDPRGRACWLGLS